MTADEVAGLLSYLAEQYPNATPAGDPRRRVSVWLDVMAPYEGRRMMEAARTHVRSGNKWFPTPAELFAIHGVATYGDLPSESEAWGMCTSHHTQAELELMHPVLRECIQITGGIQTLSWMDERDMRRHIRSAYYRALRSFEIHQDPELPEAPMHERLAGGRARGPSPISGEVTMIDEPWNVFVEKEAPEDEVERALVAVGSGAMYVVVLRVFGGDHKRAARALRNLQKRGAIVHGNDGWITVRYPDAQ